MKERINLIKISNKHILMDTLFQEVTLCHLCTDSEKKRVLQIIKDNDWDKLKTFLQNNALQDSVVAVGKKCILCFYGSSKSCSTLNLYGYIKYMNKIDKTFESFN